MFDSKLDILLYLESLQGKLSRDMVALNDEINEVKKDVELLKTDMVEGIQKHGEIFTTDTIKVSIRKGKERVIIKDKEKLPANMLGSHTYTRTEPSLTAIKKAIEDGHEIDGAYIETGADTLSIKGK